MSLVRAEYVEALKAERDQLSSRVQSPVQKRRLAEVDAELDQFTEKPVARQVEKAVPKK